MSRMRLLLPAMLLLSASLAHAQQSADGRRSVVVEERAAAATDVATIDGVMRAFYEVISGPKGRPRQWARDRNLYVKDVRFFPIDMRNGSPRMSVMSHQQYVDAVDSGFVATGFMERETARCTRRFGNLAQVWSAYEEWRGDARKDVGRGVNALQFYWDGTRWWITSVSWDSERANNRVPATSVALCRQMAPG